MQFESELYRTSNLPDYPNNYEPGTWDTDNYESNYLIDARNNRYNNNLDRNYYTNYYKQPTVQNMYKDRVKTDYIDNGEYDVDDKDFNNETFDTRNYYQEESPTAKDVPRHNDNYYNLNVRSSYDIHKMRDRALINYDRSGPNNDSYTIIELKQYAKELGLSTTGNKAMLVDRILEDRDTFDI